MKPTRTPQLSQGMEECGHRCVNKSTCAHDCCRNGVIKRKPAKTRPKTPLAPKTRPMDNYVNSLKDRVSQTPNVAKRLKVLLVYSLSRKSKFINYEMAKILPIRRKTLYNQSNNHTPYRQYISHLLFISFINGGHLWLGLLFLFVWSFCRTRTFFTSLETSPFSVKGCKFWPMLSTHGHLAVRVL